MENTRIISFVGMERCDAIMYLTNVLETKKTRILVIDNSCSHDLFLSLRRPDEEIDYVEHGSTIYMRNKYVTEESADAFEKFDVVILYHGLNIDYDMADMSDFVLLQTDFLPTTMRTLEQNVDMQYMDELPKDKFGIMYRDKTSGKIAEQYVKKEYGLSKIELEYVIYLDETNYDCYLNMLYNGYQNLKGANGEMKAAINELRVILIGDDKKKKKKGGDK